MRNTCESVSVSVNGFKLLPEVVVLTDFCETEYDEVASYFYKDGEIIDFECSYNEPSFNLQLKYYDSTGTLQLQSNRENSPYYFRSLFTTHNNNSYIVCILTTPSPKNERYYKTFFIQQNPDSDKTLNDSVIQVSINGLRLVPLPSNSSEHNYDRYQYKYIPGDVLNVTCEKRTRIAGRLDFKFSRPDYATWRKIQNKEISISLDTSREFIHKEILICEIKTSDVQNTFAEVQFLSEMHNNGLRVQGLLPNNVEYQYSNGTDQWVIGYRYRENETLNLNCVSEYSFLRSFHHRLLIWMFGKHLIRAEEHYNTDIGTTSISGYFTLEKMHDQSEITCKRGIMIHSLKVTIVLHLQANLARTQQNYIEDNTENPVVQLSCTDSTEFLYTAVKNRPLRIILKDCNAKYMWCIDFYISKKYVTFQEIVSVESHNRTSIVTIPSVTDAMSTRWLCSILEDLHGPPTMVYGPRTYTLIRRWFHLHVKGARSVKLSVNGLRLLPEQTDLSDKEYDGVASYIYRDGEIIDFECSCIEPSDTVQLKYYDSKGSLQFQTNILETTPYYFRSLFTTHNNSSYMVCILTTPSPQKEYYYKTIFILQNPDSDTTSKDSVIQVSINGLKLVPLPSNSSEDNYDRYQYKYIPGDVLNVTCEKRTRIAGRLDFKFSSVLQTQNYLTQKADGKTSVLLDASRQVFNKKFFLEVHVENTDLQKIFTKILFLSDLQGSGPCIRGLLPKNVEYQYSNGRNQWVIGYRYRANETLSLTCVYKYLHSFYTEELQWIFGKEVIRPEIHYNDYIQTKYITRNFTLEEMYNNTEITCKRSYTSKANTVILNNVKKVKLVLHLQSASSLDTEDNTDVGELILILSTAFAVMVIVVTGVCLICWCSRTKQAMLMENAYENLSNQNDSPIPAFPSQWENQYEDSHYSQIDENAILEDPAHSRDTKKLYATPNMRKSKTPSENHYTEIDEYFKHNSVNLRNTKTFSHHKNSSANFIHEYHNSLYDTKLNIPTYDVLRRSDLMSSKSKIDNCDCEVSTSKAGTTLRQNIDNIRLAGNVNKEANCSARDNKNKSDKLGLNACVIRNKGDAYSMTNDVATKYEIIRGQNDKDTNSVDYAETYSDFDGVMCNNDLYS